MTKPHGKTCPEVNGANGSTKKKKEVKNSWCLSLPPRGGTVTQKQMLHYEPA